MYDVLLGRQSHRTGSRLFRTSRLRVAPATINLAGAEVELARAGARIHLKKALASCPKGCITAF